MTMRTIGFLGEEVHEPGAVGFPESRLQAAWVRLRAGRRLRTNDGREVTVLSPGTWNVEAGPDFRQARLEIGGQAMCGDVEIHCRAGDWLRHGHEGDPRYAGVVLHVVGEDDTRGRAIPLPHPIVELAPVGNRYALTMARRYPAGDCRELFSADDDDTLRADFQAAGVERAQGKAAEMLQDMLAPGAARAPHRRLFAACGYKQNRAPFRQLHDRYASLFPGGMPNGLAPEHVLWGLAGLLPDPTATPLEAPMAAYVQSCWQAWWKLRPEAAPPLSWQRHGLRPLNRPERRIAAAGLLLERLGRHPLRRLGAMLADAGEPALRRVAALLELLICRHPLWDGHLGFAERAPRSAAVLGRARAIDLAANVVVPALLAHAELEADPPLAAQTLEIFRHLPSPQENRILAIAAHRWFMPPDRARHIFAGAAAAQGGIHLFRNFCELRAGDCHECPVAHRTTVGGRGKCGMRNGDGVGG